MSTAVGTPLPVWSKARWLTVVLLVLLLQAGLVIGLTRWPSLPAPVLTPHAQVRLSNGAVAVSPEADALLPDPLLFVRDDPHGFSGAVARSLPRSDYEVAELTETPHWLALDPAVRRVGQPPRRADPPAYRPSAIALAVPVGDAIAPLLEATSQVSVRGGLARRPLTEPLNPPLMKSADVLQASVVEVGVTGAGDVLMARLVSSSGLPMADETALDLARRARFTPLNGDRRDPALATTDAEWGELAFIWRTEP